MSIFGVKPLADTNRFSPSLNAGGWAKWLAWLRQANNQPNFILNPKQQALQEAFIKGQLAYYVCDTGEIATLKKAYVLFLLSLCVFFPVRSVQRYHYRFFTPLFVLYAIGKILSLSTNLQQLARASPLTLFGGTVSLGAILLLTVGLYFWIVGAFLLERLFLRLFAVGISLEPGAAQAALLLIRYFLIGLGIVGIFGYVEGEMSKFKKLGIRAAIVQVLRDNSEKIIPNQTFFTENVTTYTGSDRLVYRSLTLGASYGCNPQIVLGILKQVALQHPKVLKEPAPVAFFIEFGESSLNFELKFWIDDPLNGKSITSELGCVVWQAFAEQGIEIPFPQRDLHIRSVDG